MLKVSNINLIGKKIKIINSSDPTKNDLKGIVIFETKNNLVLRKKDLKIIKIRKSEIIKNKIYMWFLRQKMILKIFQQNIVLEEN